MIFDCTFLSFFNLHLGKYPSKLDYLLIQKSEESNSIKIEATVIAVALRSVERMAGRMKKWIIRRQGNDICSKPYLQLIIYDLSNR